MAIAGLARVWGAIAVLGQIASPYRALADFSRENTAPPISIVSATFGTLGTRRILDITVRLQVLCGTGAQSCSIFCSETSFGRYNLGRKAICRVAYRCGPDFVRSVEATHEEPILMRCPERSVDEPRSDISLIPPSPSY